MINKSKVKRMYDEYESEFGGEVTDAIVYIQSKTGYNYNDVEKILAKDFGIYEDEKKAHKILDEKSYGKRIANYDDSDYIVDRFETIIIKETHNKINFIDENDVYVGFDYIKGCCERFCWYITNEKDGEPLFPANKLTGYVFDTSVNYHQYETKLDDVGRVSFKMIKDGCEDIYLTLFNHNKGRVS